MRAIKKPVEYEEKRFNLDTMEAAAALRGLPVDVTTLTRSENHVIHVAVRTEEKEEAGHLGNKRRRPRISRKLGQKNARDL